MSEKQTGQNTTTRERPTSGKNIIAVASGKGGVGKTWFSITLSHALARQGKKVLLFDGDLGLANVDVQLGLMPKRDLNDVIEGTLTLAHAIHKYTEGGFDVLAGRSGQAALSTLPVEKLNELRRQLVEVSANYDAIILDLGAGVDKTVRFLASFAANVLLVATDEPTSLTDAYAFIKLSHAAGLSDTIRIVINMAATDKEGEKTYNTLLKASQNFLKISPDLAGIIRQDKNVKEAIRNQTPLLIRSPNSEAAGDIEKIARLVAELV